jgi:hypothetical protein
MKKRENCEESIEYLKGGSDMKLTNRGLEAIIYAIYKSMPSKVSDMTKNDRYEYITQVIMDQDYIELDPETDLDLLGLMTMMLINYYE